MKKIFFTGLLMLTVNFYVSAQEKRALVIGIDTYSPPDDYQPPSDAGRIEFSDLDGCVNDARSIISIITSRFQFSPDKIDTLFNTDATRASILKQINELYEKSKSGDIAFLYYAGHGSQVKNSLSREADKKDESMVPCDTWKAGVSDIRDKELAAIYNKFIDKGVKLTVIMDCCHSGSLSRGPQDPQPDKFRFIAESNYDAKDASVPTAPETRKEGNFLIMSAAQDNEFAQEQRDEQGQAHGAFTIALTEALNQQGVNASAFNLFTSIQAILKSNGKKQQPVMGGSLDRQAQTLFGLEKGSLPDKSLIAISQILPNGRVELLGGFALGLYKENELVKFKDKDTLVKLRVESVTSINKSVAKVIQGSVDDLKPGELVEVTNWVSSEAPLLKLYIPAGNMTYEELQKLVSISKELRNSKKIKWVDDLKKWDPYTTIFFNNGKCYVNIDGKPLQELKEVSTENILKLCKQDSTVYFELPASTELADYITKKLKQNQNFTLVNRASEANYVLYGSINDQGVPVYGLRRAQTSSRDSLESMPMRTTAFSLKENVNDAYQYVADSVYDYAMKLSKIRGWMQLAGPAAGKSEFPFHLEIFNKTTKKPIGKNGYKIGDTVLLKIVADKNYNPYKITTKYIYVFAIDQNGNMTLGYPDPEGGNVQNKFPHMVNNKIAESVELFEYTVTEPSGTDNLFLLATSEPINNYAILFNQEGVRSVSTRGERNALGELLNVGNTQTRSGFDKKPLPANWVLVKLPVKSRH